MKHIIAILLIVIGILPLWGQTDFKPDNPMEPGQYYNLTVQVYPEGAGSVSPSGKGQYRLGQDVGLNAYANGGYYFVEWRQADTIVSKSSSFSYRIPARHSTLTAVFTYRPGNPSEPSQMGLRHKLTFKIPIGESGSTNITSGTLFKEGDWVDLQFYLNTGYVFNGWKQADTLVTQSPRYSFIMGKQDVNLTAMTAFHPSDPEIPGKNDWNKTSGEVIVDHFTPGNLQEAIDNAIGGSQNRSQVTMVIVSGTMNWNDFGIANYLSNCSMLDLRRATGITEIPSYAFDGTNLSRIILPAEIEHIGYCAFANCANLSEISCYAAAPPKIEAYAFAGIQSGAVLHVLPSAMALYAEAEGWKDFSILALTEDVHSLEISLPDLSADGRYKNMSIELLNRETAQKQRFVISDRLKYTFNGLLSNSCYNVYLKNQLGSILGEIDSICILSADVAQTFTSILTPREVTLKIITPTSTDVTEQTQIDWTDKNGTFLSRGNSLKGLTAGTELYYALTLNQTLGMEYKLPEKQHYAVKDSDNSFTLSLVPLDTIKISGIVKSKDGSLINGATVSVSQQLNGRYSKSFLVQTDNRGVFSLIAYKGKTSFAISCSNYITENIMLDSLNKKPYSFVLKPITGATITTGFTYTTSVAKGGTADTQSGYADYANVSYTLYNVTQQKAINSFSVQYPSIVLLDEVNKGDRIALTATSKTNAFKAVRDTVEIDTLNRASATFSIVARGGIHATFQETANASVVGILYDANGNLLKKYNYASASLTISSLPDGNYTLVNMAASTLFNSVYRLNQLSASGLQENSDYIKNEVTVVTGYISEVSNNLIPKLDESKLYYTGENTTFSVNKSSVVAGNYLTLKGKMDFKQIYAAQVSDVKMLIDLPEGTSFVENSVMVGTKVSAYTLEGSRLTIPLTNYTSEVRFCIIPTDAGDFSPNAFAEFKLADKVIIQPIGSTNYTVKALSITVPGTIAKETLPISGTATPHSTIEIFDGIALIGQTTSLANGQWSTTCTLNNPYNLSSHGIYAKVTTKTGLVLESETQNCIYDKNAIEVNTVTMLNTAHGASSLNLLEYRTVFNFQKPSTQSKTYWYWPSYPTFTFLIDFTNNDTTKISNVVVNVETHRGKVVSLSAQYDKNKGLWVSVGDFNNDNGVPKNVSVHFDFLSELCYDEKQTTDATALILDKIKNAEQDSSKMDVLYASLSEEYEKEMIDTAKIQSLRDSLDLLSPQIDVVLTSKDSLVIDSLNHAKTDEEFLMILTRYVNQPNATDYIEAFAPKYPTTPISFGDDKYGTITFTPNSIGNPNLDLLKGNWQPDIPDFDDSSPLSFPKQVSFTDKNTGDQIKISMGETLNVPDGEEALSNPTVMKGFLNKLNSFVSDYNLQIGTVNDLTNNYLDQCKRILDQKIELNNYVREFIEKSNPTTWNKKRLSDCIKVEKQLSGKLSKVKLASTMLNIVGKGLLAYGTYSDISSGFDSYNKWVNLEGKIWQLCDHDEAQKIVDKLKVYEKQCAKYSWWIGSINAGIAIGTAVASGFVETSAVAAGTGVGTVALPATLGTALTITAVSTTASLANSFYGQWAQNKNKNNYSEILGLIKNSSKCKPLTDEDDDTGFPSGDGDAIDVQDPSGYVYEGVSSNRLEGVTATCYYKEMVQDMYGDKHEQVTFWDAEDYAQKNPLFTDKNGMYAWDVPQGLWQVKFEKQGYQTTYSDWLPVPPPQLDINIAMKQNAQPNVKNVKAYEDGIELEFDKYMLPESMTTENISVTKNGTNVKGKVTLLNEEKTSSEDATTYVSKVRFIPEEAFLTTDEIRLTVSHRVKSYAGIQMESDYAQSFDIVKEVKQIATDSLLKVLYNGKKQITVSVLPYDAAIGKKLTAVSSSPLISRVTPEAVLDQNGQAILEVTGDLPGSTVISYTVEESDVQNRTVVQVINELQTISEPKASRASGTEVYRGTTVTLSSDTKGAVIYYTTDGTCPCDENGTRKVYTQPLSIISDMTIKAISWTNDLGESNVDSFSYVIKRNTLGMNLKKGWNWISHNMETDLVPTTVANSGVSRFVGQTSELVRDPQFGLIGNLKLACVGNGYKVLMDVDSSYTLKGYECDPSQTPISLKKGWNWTGYLVNQVLTPVEALKNTVAEEEDLLVGQDGFVQYQNGGWIGTLTMMQPGQGYLYYSLSDKSLVYTTNPTSKSRSLYAGGLSVVPPWVADKYAYPNIMCLVADLYDGTLIANEKAFLVGAFCGTECRGVGRYVSGRLMMSVYGEGGEIIHFRALNNETEQMMDVLETVPFSQNLLGSIKLPFALHLNGTFTDIKNQSNQWNAYISTDDRLHINGLDDIQTVSLTNAEGIKVFHAEWSLSTLPSVVSLPTGMYVLSVKTKTGKMFYKKLIK